ncbi:hypothetical protein [Atopobium sp. oral taxon 416]|uniref:hypothetical protein n=1 Tax=Atopobium sp. oral taxon 416 TaxID=712157 RepID=UPI001BA57F10|nr:hypothetical protein [Atopobium sp. oral taxon 416]QUC04036.1 hypothetical protein J4859_03600 [Atopobium sp. oral taxon 416]
MAQAAVVNMRAGANMVAAQRNLFCAPAQATKGEFAPWRNRLELLFEFLKRMAREGLKPPEFSTGGQTLITPHQSALTRTCGDFRPTIAF